MTSCVYYSLTLLFLQGFAPHISPFAEVRDLGNLLTRSGFSLTTVVSLFCGKSMMTVHLNLYSDVFDVLKHVLAISMHCKEHRGMVESKLSRKCGLI